MKTLRFFLLLAAVLAATVLAGILGWLAGTKAQQSRHDQGELERAKEYLERARPGFLCTSRCRGRCRRQHERCAGILGASGICQQPEACEVDCASVCRGIASGRCQKEWFCASLGACEQVTLC